MRTFTTIGLVLMTAVIHGCGAGGNAEQSAVDATPEAVPAAMETPAAPSEPAALNHAVDPATLGLMLDPVCKMSFKEYAVVTTAEHAGTNYGFCSEFCKKNFAKDPDKILAKAAVATPAP